MVQYEKSVCITCTTETLGQAGSKYQRNLLNPLIILFKRHFTLALGANLGAGQVQFHSIWLSFAIINFLG